MINQSFKANGGCVVPLFSSKRGVSLSGHEMSQKSNHLSKFLVAEILNPTAILFLYKIQKSGLLYRRRGRFSTLTNTSNIRVRHNEASIAEAGHVVQRYRFRTSERSVHDMLCTTQKTTSLIA